MNKNLLFLLIAFLISAMGFSQEWHTSLDTAKVKAKEDKKPIVLVFQGSDWCAPCIKLDREVWSTAEFKEYATDHYVLLQADFPRKKANILSDEQTLANKNLAEEYNPRGIFPLVVLLDAEGKQLGQTSYKRLSPAEYIKELNSYLN